MQTIFPIIRYQDARGGIEWLCRVFGFSEIFSVPPQGEPVRHARLCLGTNLIMVGTVRPEDGIDTPGALGKCTQALYIHVADVDAHYLKAVEGGAQVLAPPEDTQFGSRDYSAKDPEGHLWIFGTHLPEVPAGRF